MIKPHQLNQDYMYFVQLPYYYLVYVIANCQLSLYIVEQDQHELNTKKYLPTVISGIKQKTVQNNLITKRMTVSIKFA